MRRLSEAARERLGDITIVLSDVIGAPQLAQNYCRRIGLTTLSATTPDIGWPCTIVAPARLPEPRLAKGEYLAFGNGRSGVGATDFS